jgi:hypothetical protein
MQARTLFDDETLEAVRTPLLEECRKEYFRGLKTAVLNYFLLCDTTWRRMSPLRLPRPPRSRPRAPRLALAVSAESHRPSASPGLSHSLTLALAVSAESHRPSASPGLSHSLTLALAVSAESHRPSA